MSLIALDHGDFSATLSPRGGALWSFEMRHQGRTFPLLQTRGDGASDGADLSGCFPLVPFGNRVRGNGFSLAGKHHVFLANTDDDPFYLHGDGWLGEWQIVEHAQSRCRLSFEKQQDAEGTASPYVYRATEDITLDDEGLILTLTVTNLGDETLPFGLGWHPFFPLTSRTRLTAGASHYWTEESDRLPGSREALPRALDFNEAQSLPDHWVNNGFEGWDGLAEIAWPDDNLMLEIRASDLFTRYQIFVSDISFDPTYQKDFFCFEPMSHAVDAHNQEGLAGLRLLESGEILSGSMRLQPRMG
ncbi:aldose 1-epimerase [Cohaesibacter marisflavi]|uniref:aldose 1-epimerase n=1 Tax=Cohaesibacter marisflavi TaxID=655353 RepID=UPI0029C6EC8B|nr:aldose 1-epimerase [Cohaesibacter marisflavi]